MSLIPYKSKQKKGKCQSQNGHPWNCFHNKAGNILQNQKSGGSEWIHERNNK